MECTSTLEHDALRTVFDVPSAGSRGKGVGTHQ